VAGRGGIILSTTDGDKYRINGNGSGKPGLLRRWTEFLVNHPKHVLLGGLIILVLYGAGAVALRGEFADSFELPGSESQQAYDLLEERFPQQAGSTAQIVFKTDADGGINNPEVQSQIQAFMDQAMTLPHVVSAISPLDAPNQISDEGNIAYATVYYDVLSTDLPLADAQQLVDTIDAANSDTLTVTGGGDVVVLTEQEFGSTAELVGIIAAAIILLIAFGSVVAMGLPIVTALIGLLIGLLGVGVVANYLNVATFAPIFASMIGIGVGIDYALFIVTRFREGLSGGMTPREATGRAIDTAGRAVIFAGAVVVISMLGLSVIGVEFITSLGIAAAFVVASAVVVALSFLPVFLVWPASEQSHPGPSWPLRSGSRCRPALPRAADSPDQSWLPGCGRQSQGFSFAPGVRPHGRRVRGGLWQPAHSGCR
jgi:RND superfamily putative drug exporter